MTTHRFYIPSENIDKKNKTVFLSGDEWKHAERVLRLKSGDQLEFFDGQGNVYHSIISLTDKKIFSLAIKKITFQKQDYSLDVFVGIPKGAKTDLIIKALTETGATMIGMFTSKYSDVSAKSDRKIERLRKISIEACKQSKRAWLPKLEINLSFKDVLSRLNTAQNAIVYYEKASKYLSLGSLKSKELALVIGPEGGFAESEIDELKTTGAQISRLNDAVLRVETAAIAASSCARYAQQLSSKF